MFANRFLKQIYITRHARERMAQRFVDDETLVDVIETGEVRYKDDVRIWVAKAVGGRQDNLICAAAILEDELVVKTVPHYFCWDG